MKPVLVSGAQTVPSESTLPTPNASEGPSGNDGTQNSQPTTGFELLIAMVIVALIGAGAILLVYRKKQKHKSNLDTTSLDR